jgi:hypothetical protein
VPLKNFEAWETQRRAAKSVQKIDPTECVVLGHRVEAFSLLKAGTYPADWKIASAFFRSPNIRIKSIGRRLTADL